MAIKKTVGVRNIYNTTFTLFKEHKLLLVPFCLYFITELLLLVLLYFSPRMPLKIAFGPFIKAFWGETYLHYPTNFLLLPQLFSNFRTWLMIILSSFFSGTALFLFTRIQSKKHPALGVSMRDALKKYVYLLLIVGLSLGLFFAANKLLNKLLVWYFMAGHVKLLGLGVRWWLGPIAVAINFGMAIFVQSLFIYALPILIFDNVKMPPAIVRSMLFFKKRFLLTLVLTGLPMLTYIPVIILQYNPAFIIAKTSPEIIAYIVAGGSLLSCLFIDPITTISTAVLYWQSKE